MKRVIGLFLLVSYLLSSPGLVYSMHFCGQTLTAVFMAPDADRHCCCEAAHKPPCRCCHDQKVSSAIKDVKLSAAEFKLVAPALVATAAVLHCRWLLWQAAGPADEPATRLLAPAAPPPKCPTYVRGHALLV